MDAMRRMGMAVVLAATLLVTGCSLGLHAQMAGTGGGLDGKVDSGGPGVVIVDKDGDEWATFDVRTIASKLIALVGGLLVPPKSGA